MAGQHASQRSCKRRNRGEGAHVQFVSLEELHGGALPWAICEIARWGTSVGVNSGHRATKAGCWFFQEIRDERRAKKTRRLAWLVVLLIGLLSERSVAQERRATYLVEVMRDGTWMMYGGGSVDPGTASRISDAAFDLCIFGGARQ